MVSSSGTPRLKVVDPPEEKDREERSLGRPRPLVLRVPEAVRVVCGEPDPACPCAKIALLGRRAHAVGPDEGGSLLLFITSARGCMASRKETNGHGVVFRWVSAIPVLCVWLRGGYR